MQYRILGKTGLEVSSLGFGGIPIKRVGEEEAISVVNRALDLGVNFIHTSITYGDSAYKIGQVMKDRRDECFLAVKLLRRGEMTAKEAKFKLTKSLEALKTDHIDIAELRLDASELPRVMGPDGAYRIVEDAKKEGIIDFIGITSHDVNFLTEAITSNAFSNLITPFNYVANTAKQRLLPLAAELDLGVIAMKTIGRGGLLNAEQALKYVLNHSIDTAIVGMSSISEVKQNVKTVNNLQPLTVEEETELQKIAEKIITVNGLSSSGAVLIPIR